MGINVLSLCDGMSCGHIALDRAGIRVDKYFASEIKDIAIKVTMNNYPNTIQIGDVHNINYKNGVLHTENGDFIINIDLVIFGSPCQSFSQAIRADMRTGLKDKMRSGLFFECYRVLNEVKPKWYLFENVGGMKDSDRDILSSMMGVNPIKINSALVSAALRSRYYWSNIPVVGLPRNKNIKLQSALVYGYTERDKARCLMASDSRPNKTPIKMFHRYYSIGFTTLIFKSKEHYQKCLDEYKRLTGGNRKVKAETLDHYTGHVFDGVRYMNQKELEACQTVPQGYTKCLTRNEAANVLGDGWTVDIIAWIFSFMKNEFGNH